MTLWAWRIGFLAAGLGLGALLHPRADSQRFLWDQNSNVLDTKTGQACVPTSAIVKDLPNCLDLYKKY